MRTADSRETGFGVALGTGLVVAVAPLWLVDSLPLVDLPQHAAQVSFWLRWGDDGAAASGVPLSELLEINLRTPYLLSRLLAFLLAHLVPVLDAYRILLSLTVVGIPLATLALLRRTGGSPWWALATLPLGYGYSFYWGFVAFGLATPLGLLHLAFVLGCLDPRSPGDDGVRDLSPRRQIVLWLATQALFFAHVFVFGWAGLTAAAVLGLHALRLGQKATGERSLTARGLEAGRRLLRAWWPLLGALPLPMAWLAVTRSAEAGVAGPLVGAWGTRRLAQAFRFLVDAERAGATAALLGIALVAVPLALGARPSRRLERWAPLGVSIALFLAAPLVIFGTAFIYPRFAVFLLPTWLMVLEPSRPVGRRGWLLAGLVAVALVDIGLRLQRFDAEVGDFGRLVDAMEPERRVLYCALDHSSQPVSTPAYLHFGQWYQVEKGGLVEFSFAHFFPNLFRYREGAEPLLGDDFDWTCWRFDYHANGGAHYDYFLVRSKTRDPYLVLFDEAQAEIVPLARARGGWWLYGRRGHVPSLAAPGAESPVPML